MKNAARVAGAMAAVVMLAAVVACSSSKATSTGSGDTAAPNGTSAADAGVSALPTAVSDAPARPSAGCAGPSSLTAGPHDLTLDVSGVQRQYRLFIPASAATGTPLPMTFNIHGLTSNIAEQVAVSGFETLADTEGFMVATPQGLGDKWEFPNQPSNKDLPFFKAMIDAVGAATCLDLARVYSAGISNGGIMSSILACQMGDQIAAVGLVSGIRQPTNCSTDRPMPVMVFWGKQDNVLPYYGGLGPLLTGLGRGGTDGTVPPPPTAPPADLQGFPPVEQVVGEWAAHDGCRADPTVLTVGSADSDVEERVFTDCTPESSVRFFVVSDGGHTWPGSPVLKGVNDPSSPLHQMMATTTYEVDASAAIWAFFRGYALTG
ncbi:MAG: alpha/beta hydrolase family esterase [Acidimicrobiales bacterium]